MVRLVVLAFLAVFAPDSDLRSQVREPVCVVANLPSGAEVQDVDVVRRIFMLRQRFWPDGSPAHPVNLPASSPVRDHFAESVFGQSVRDMAPYWNDRYFHGTRPPPTMASEAAVLLFVARTPGGVGYVPERLSADLPASARTLLCIE